MSSTAIRALLDEARAAFDRPPDAVEHGPGVEDAALLQLRKACRLLDGAIALLDAGYYTLVVEASFVAIEFRLLERGELQPRAPGLPSRYLRRGGWRRPLRGGRRCGLRRPLAGPPGENVLSGRTGEQRASGADARSLDRSPHLRGRSLFAGPRVHLRGVSLYRRGHGVTPAERRQFPSSHSAP